jgi:hypothetical protein
MGSPGPLENPYQPPRSALADFNDAPFAGRPRLINVAAGLIVASLPVGYLYAALQWDLLGLEGMLVLYVIIAAVMTSVVAWITYEIWQGRNWARIVLLIVTLWGVAFSAREVPPLFVDAPVVASVFVFRYVLVLAALAIAFLTPARHWFSKRREPAR